MRLMLTAILLLFCGSYAAAQDTKDVATLRFAWPAGIAAEVEMSADRTRISGGKEVTRSIAASYRMTAKSIPDGLQITYEPIAIEASVHGVANETAAQLEKFVAKASSLMPSLIVGHDGAVLRVEGIEPLAALMRESIEGSLEDLPTDQRQQLKQLADQLLSRPIIEASARNQWHRDVGFWLGAELEHGQTYELQATEPLPALGNAQIDMIMRFTFLGRVPCDDGSADARCVEIELRSMPDPDTFAQAIEEFIARVIDSVPGPQIESMELETTIRLTTEPDTLLPHRMHQTLTNKITAIDPNGETSVVRQEDETLVVYRY